MIRYRLIFRGELVPGVSREAFIARVARQLDESTDEVEQSFFGKGTVVVKDTDDRDEARRYQQVFRQMGAVLELQGGGRRKGMRWAAAVMVLLVLLAGAAAWYAQPLWRTAAHPDVARAEAALASSGLAALFHADVRRAVAIENRFMGASDLEGLPGPAGDALWTALRQAGVEPRTAIQQAVVGARLKDGGWRLALILLGEFDPPAVRRALETAYQPADGAGEHFYFRMLDPKTCEPSAVMAAAITTERVVVAPAKRIEQLLQRYRNGSEPGVDLSEWRRFRAERILGAGVFAPRAVVGTASGLAGMLLQGAGSQLVALDSAFIGLTARALPPGANLAAAIHAADTDWIAEQHAAARTALDSARRSVGQRSLTLAKLLQRIELERAPNRLGASIDLDRDFHDQLAAGLSEAMSNVFDTGTISSDGTAEERVVENPDRFLRQMTAAELPAFDDIDDNSFTAQWHDGPFGVRIQEAGVIPEQGNRAYLMLEAHGRDLPNVADEASNVRLRIEDVLDAEEQSIMPKPECGADRNQDPVVFASHGAGSYFRDGDFVNYRKHAAEKRILLTPGAGLESIEAIRGVIELNLPVQTVREVLQPPLDGKQVQRNGARVAFKAGGERMLSFETSGELSRILAVRALNADGQVLDSRGETSMSRLFGAGQAINRNISGEIDRVEVILATGIESLRYPFTLRTAYPPQDDSHYSRPGPGLADPAAMDAALAAGVPQQAQAFENMQPQATATAGPVVLALQDLRTGGFYDFYARLRMRTPVIDGLGWNFSAGVIEVTEVAGADDDWTGLGLRRAFELDPQGMIMNGVFQPDEDRPFMQADVDLRGAYDGPEVTRLRGSVSLRAPTALQTARLEPFRLGETVEGAGVRLTPVALTAGAVRIAGAGRRERLVGMHLLDGEGRRVDRGVRFESGDEKGWSARLSIGSAPAALKLISSDAFVERSYDFTLETE